MRIEWLILRFLLALSWGGLAAGALVLSAATSERDELLWIGAGTCAVATMTLLVSYLLLARMNNRLNRHIRVALYELFVKSTTPH